MKLHFKDEENTEEEPGGGISRPMFRHRVPRFFRVDREGPPLGVTRILRLVTFCLCLSRYTFPAGRLHPRERERTLFILQYTHDYPSS